MKIKLLIIAIISLLCFLTCCQTKTQTDTAWINKKNLTIDEIIDSVTADVERVQYFKYTTSNSTNTNFFSGQKVNTFLLDKNGNAFSNRNGEQNYRVDGKVYSRRVELREEGLLAIVLLDILKKEPTDEKYFERNTPYIKTNANINIRGIKDCDVIISASGSTITMETTDFENVNNKSKDKLKNVTVKYTPNEELLCIMDFIDFDEKAVTLTYKFIFNPDEKVKLPEVMKVGTSLSAEK